MAGEAAAKNKGVEEPKEKAKKIRNRARNFLGRIFRTGTELRNLLEVRCKSEFSKKSIFLPFSDKQHTH
jgi:hypothetical protein